jgi:multidrug transporter EmrE-like cation transporter
MRTRIILGLVIVCSAALCYNMGVVLQAVEVRRTRPATSLSPRVFGRLARTPRWVTGATLNLVGWALQAWSLTMLPLSVVQPALSVGFVFLFGLSHLLLGERPGRRELASAAVLIAGVALISTRAPAPGPPSRSTAAWTFAFAPLAAVVVIPYVLRGCGRRPGWLALSGSAGAAYAVTGVTTAALARSLVKSRILLAAGVGVATAFCGGVGFLSETLALGEGRVTAVVPVLAAIDTAVPVAYAPWLFHESWPAGLHSGLMVATGLVLAGVGIAGLTTATPRRPVPDDVQRR